MSTLTIPISFPIRKGLFIFVTQPYPAAVLALHMQYYRFHTCAVRTVISSLAREQKKGQTPGSALHIPEAAFPPDFLKNCPMTCSLSSPGRASKTPSVTIISLSPSHNFCERRTGSACPKAPAGTWPAFNTCMPSSPITKVGAAPSLNTSRAPVYRSIQPASNAAGCCSPPAKRSTVIYQFKSGSGGKTGFQKRL